MARPSMGRRPRKNWAEVDVTSRWGRRYLCWVNNHQARGKVKRMIRRRERRQQRQRGDDA